MIERAEMEQGHFVGRVWRQDVKGPAVAALRKGRLVDIT
jgi:fumarylacetoacetate (FAA) hydrolase family protein